MKKVGVKIMTSMSTKVGYGVGGVVGLALLIVIGLYFGGMFDTATASPQPIQLEKKGPVAKDESSGSFDIVVAGAGKIEHFDQVLNSQDRITDMEEKVLKKVQERTGMKVVAKPVVVTEGKPAEDKLPVQNSPVINLKVELPAKQQPSKKEAKGEKAPSAKDVKTSAKPIPKWTPDAIKLKPTQLSQIAFRFIYLSVDLMSVKSEDDLKKATKKARKLVKSVFSDVKRFAKENYSLVQALNPLAPKMPDILIDGFFDAQMNAKLNDITPQSVADFIPQLKSLSRKVITLLYPILVPLDSFAGMTIENEKNFTDAFAVLHALIFADKFEKDSFTVEAMETVKTAIRSPEFLKALEKIYAEKDFALLLAAETSDEFIAILKVLMGNPKNHLILPLLLSVLEEPSVRVSQQLLAKMSSSSDANIKKLFKLFKRILGLIQAFKFDQNITKELIELFQEILPMQSDRTLSVQLKQLFTPENIEKCAKEVFGENAEEKMKLLPYFFQNREMLKEKIAKDENTFSAIAKRNVDAKNLWKFAEDYAGLGMTSTFFIQLILRLA